MTERDQRGSEVAGSDAPLTRRALLGGLGVAAIASLAGCNSALLEVDRAETTLDREFDPADVDRIQVPEATDDVAIESGPTDRIRVRVHKNAFGGTELSDLEFHSEQSGETLRLRTEKPSVFGIGGGGIDLEVAVPAGVRVDRIETGDGDVALRGTAGDSTVQTGDGDLAATDVTGDLTLETDDGDVSVNGTNGTVTARTDDGDVAIRDPGRIETVRTDDGDVAVDVPAVTEQATIRTGDGDIACRMADSLNATVEVRTDDGDLTVSDGVGSLNAVSDERIEVTVGDGDRSLTVRTSDGDVVMN